MVYRISDKQNNRKAQAGKTSEPQKPWDAICTNHTKYVFTCFWHLPDPVNGYPTHYKTLSSVDQHNVYTNTSLGSAGPDAIVIVLHRCLGGSSHCAQKEMVEPQGSWEGKISMFSL